MELAKEAEIKDGNEYPNIINEVRKPLKSKVTGKLSGGNNCTSIREIIKYLIFSQMSYGKRIQL